MKKNNQWYLISFISLTLAVLIAGFIIINNNYKEMKRVSDDNEQKSAHIDALLSNIQLNYRFNNFPYTYEIEDIYGKKQDLHTILAGGRKIVLRYSELNCDICVDSAIAYFTKFAEKIGTNKTMILVESKSQDYLSQFIRFNHITLPLYQIVKKNESDSISQSPFLFILDSSKQMKDIFYPLKEIPLLSNIYYDAMYNKYFKK